MPSPTLHNVGGAINLQATLSASSAGSSAESPTPHHPITCTSEIRLEEDGTFVCDHASVPPGDERTTHCLQHTVAILILELAVAAHL